MLGITAISDADYYLRGSCSPVGPSSAGAAVGPAEYELQAIAAGEPHGVWAHRGENHLGVSGEIDPEADSGSLFRSLVNDLTDSRTGEKLGRRPMHFRTADEKVAQYVADHPDATPEQVAEYRIKAEKDTRQANHAFDLTFSPPKSWSVLHAALQRAGRHEDAEKVWAALLAGINAALDQASTEHGWTRKGVGGPKINGRATTRYVRDEDFVMGVFRHHTSRDREPQLHAHVMLLNRVKLADGTWQALYSPDLTKNKHQLDATFLRVAEATLTRSMGVRFATRPDGKAREVVGVSEQVRDLFSSRTRALTEDAQQLIDAWTASKGYAPTGLIRWALLQQATLGSRRAKPKDTPTREQDLARWEQAIADSFRSGLATVVDGVDRVVDADTDTGGVPYETVDPARVIDQALADLEQRKATWSRSHLYFAISQRMPDMPAIEPARMPQLLTELTDAALASRDVVSLNAPAAAKVPASLRDAKTGELIYEAPEGRRWTTSRHLSREDSLVARLSHRGAPTVDHDRARRALAETALSPQQRATAIDVLTSARRLHLVNAGAGTGKSRLMAALSQAHLDLTGRGLSGFTTAQNAAEVLAREGVHHTANIAAFLDWHERLALGEAGPVEEAALAVPRGATVVVDEASMVSTPDLTELLSALDRSGAGKVILVGDTAQVDAVDAGGGFSMLVEEARRREQAAQRAGVVDYDGPTVRELSEVRRFNHRWEREASAALRAGDTTALTQYDARGRIHGDHDPDVVKDAAARAYVTDHLSGLESIVVTSSQEEAADVASRVRAQLVAAGHVVADGVALHDKTTAGVGDLIQTRLNDRDLGVVNREQWQVVGTASDGSLEVRRAEGVDDHGERLWGDAQTIPAAYTARWVELAYAGTVETVQGRTTDTSHTVADRTMGASQLYPATTRGRDANHVYAVLDPLERQQIEAATQRVDWLTRRVAEQVPVPAGREPDRPDPWRQHLAEAQQRLDGLRARAQTPIGRVADIVEHDDHTVSARSWIALEQDRATHLGHLGPQWQQLITEERAAAHRGVIDTVLEPAEAARVMADPAVNSLLTTLRSAEMTGHSPGMVLTMAMGHGTLDGANSPASVLHARVDAQLAATPEPTTPRGFSYEARTPIMAVGADNERLQYATAIAKAMDERTEWLGQEAAEQAPRWGVERWGPVPAEPQERALWGAKAAPIAAYREQFGWHDDRNPIGPQPTRSEPERLWAWNRAADVLGLDPREREMASLSRGDLENRRQDWQREQQWAPSHVDEQMRETHLAWDEARAQLVEARAAGEDTAERERDVTAMEQRADELEDAAEVRAAWWRDEQVTATRERAEEAKAELDRRSEVDETRERAPEEVGGAGQHESAERGHPAEPAEFEPEEEFDPSELVETEDVEPELVDGDAVLVDDAEIVEPEPAPLDDETAPGVDSAPDLATEFERTQAEVDQLIEWNTDPRYDPPDYDAHEPELDPGDVEASEPGE